MPNTKLVYMEQMQLLECKATIEEIKDLGEDKFSAILDQTSYRLTSFLNLDTLYIY